MTFSMFVHQFHFLRPEWLGLYLPFLMLLCWRWREEKIKSRWLKQLPPHLFKALTVGFNSWGNHLPIKLLCVIGGIAIVVAAGPSWYRVASPFGEDKAPLIIVLDVSKTMQQKDVAPSRIFIAKQKIQDLLARRNKGKSALIVFSGSAHTAMPLTQDTNVFNPLLAAVIPEIMPRDGKFAEYALPLVDELLSDDLKSGTVVWVGDGINQIALNTYIEYFSSTRHNLVVWGMGADNLLADYPLEVETLQALADGSGGDYVSLTMNHDDIKVVLGIIANNVEASGGFSEPWNDSGYALVWVMLLILLFWFRRGWLVQWCLVIMVSSSLSYSPNAAAKIMSWSDIWFTKDQQGQRYFDQEEYQLAAEVFEDTQWKASAYYHLGDYEKAQQYYMRSDTLPGHLGAAASLAHQREYIAARNHYRDIVRDYPNSDIAKANLVLLDKIIKDINEFTLSQSDSGAQQSSHELGEQPETSEGVSQEINQDLLIESTLDAEDILNNPEVNAIWMKRVNSDLGIFLAYKFHRQLELGTATQSEVHHELSH
ncbi:transporter [Vibrio sp. 10N.286.49.C2]|uniref:vWA domain-containing protein n=1 Tax=unclassified Vibrio TaxID=2614977 RepID=UPI000C842FC2|nr:MULTISPECIES: VWA domain-containing protein [unclassified Vibrio]PMH38839.1 transporter [Vibrio sp. 10N.286.49.C2]PMH55315.1 transporter [Vibrio sp. 10N.286.49.B1]PMH83790.1 transporter [Vibrio sp. 10N.286.48.B7]